MNFNPKKIPYSPEMLAAAIDDESDFYPKRIYIEEARKSGAAVHLPCVHNSLYGTSLREKDIYLGFRHILKLDRELAHLIPLERDLNGPYEDLEDFIQRTGIRPEPLLLVIKSGALRSGGISKRDLFWKGCNFLGRKVSREAVNLLFDPQRRKFLFSQSGQSLLEDLYDETETLGFPVSGSFSDMLLSGFRTGAGAPDLKKHTGKRIRVAGEFVSEKRVPAAGREHVKLGVFCDPDGALWDTVHFAGPEDCFALPGNGPYLISGTVKNDLGFPAIEIEMMGKLPLRPDPRSVGV